VLAPNKRQALLVFRRVLENVAGAFGEVPVQTGEPGVEYINVYITARNIRIKEIDAERA
jgi:hypothetical protein